MSTKFVLNETSYFGKGAREELPREIKERGFKKVLVVTDKALFEVGVTARVTEVLDNAGIKYTVYSEVKPNPTIKNDRSNRNGHAIGNYQLVEKLLQGKARFIQNKL